MNGWAPAPCAWSWKPARARWDWDIGERGKFDAALAERLVEAFVFEAVVFEAPNMEDDLERPMILLPTSRTRLIAEAGTHGRALPRACAMRAPRPTTWQPKA